MFAPDEAEAAGGGRRRRAGGAAAAEKKKKKKNKDAFRPSAGQTGPNSNAAGGIGRKERRRLNGPNTRRKGGRKENSQGV